MMFWSSVLSAECSASVSIDTRSPPQFRHAVLASEYARRWLETNFRVLLSTPKTRSVCAVGGRKGETPRFAYADTCDADTFEG